MFKSCEKEIFLVSIRTDTIQKVKKKWRAIVYKDMIENSLWPSIIKKRGD